VDKSKFEVDKQRQDLVLNRIDDKVTKLNEDIGLYQSQYHNQRNENGVGKKAWCRGK